MLTLSLIVFTLAKDSVSLFSPLRVQGAAFLPFLHPLGGFVGPDIFEADCSTSHPGKIFPTPIAQGSESGCAKPDASPAGRASD